MSEQLKAAVGRFFEWFDQGDPARVNDFVDPGYVDHSAMPGMPAGPEGVRCVVEMGRVAFPNMHTTIEDMVAEGDRVAVRSTLRGTHKGDFMGLPPTGNDISVSGIAIMRFVGDRLAERWEQYDEAGMMRQLGAPGAG